MSRWTPEQEAVFDSLSSTTEHIVCEAVAGSGKTTTSVEAAKRSRVTDVGFVAFNKHIAAELPGRLNGKARACTLHSLGFRAVKRAWPSIKMDERKLEKLLLNHYRPVKPLWFSAGKGRVRFGKEAQAVLKLTRLCKYTLTAGADWRELDALADHHDVEITDRTGIFDAACKLLALSQEDTTTLDFDDMVWLPVVHRLAIDRFKLLFVDESQDLNRCQHALTQQASERFCYVGDSQQAIYGFTGADSESMNRLRKDLSPCLNRPLTVTFRCPVSHVALAQQIVPHIQARDDAPDGVVSRIDPAQLYREVMPGDLVICRCNAPLLDAAYKLLAANVPVLVRGRDIGQGLIDLLLSMRASDTTDLVTKLKGYVDREQARLEALESPASKIQSLEDRVESLAILCSRFDAIEPLIQSIKDMFQDTTDDGKVVLSSVHRAKGLEADRVIILAPEKLPLVRKDQRDWELVQEHNLAYVAVTRAKQELIFAGDIPEIFGNVSCDPLLWR